MKHVVAAMAFFCFCTTAQAFDNADWFLQTSLYTTHFESKPHHNNNQALLGLEHYPNPGRDLLVGGATFRNSFGQRSVYGYAGRLFKHRKWPFYAKITAGLLYGYKGEARDAIPLNRYGVAPAVLPSIGVRLGQLSSELVVLADAGLMINMGLTF